MCACVRVCVCVRVCYWAYVRMCVRVCEWNGTCVHVDMWVQAGAAVVLGVESVPDGLASGLLAGVNPVAGLYAYMFGVGSAALVTGTAFMAVQGTGAMAIIVNDGWRGGLPFAHAL